MNKLILILLFSLPFSLQAQTLQMQTIEDNYPAALAKAKTENKMLAVVVWAMTCSASELEDALKNDNVINMYNENFVTTLVNTTHDTNQVFFDKYGRKIGLYFIEPQTGLLKHKFIGNLNSTSLYYNAQWALNPNLAYRYVVEEYKQQNGDITDKAFLLHFLKLMAGASEFEEYYFEQYRALPKNYDNLSYEDMCFIYDFFYFEVNRNHVHHYPFKENDPEFQALFNHQDKFRNYFDSLQIDYRIREIIKRSSDTILSQIINNFDTVLLQKYHPYLYGYPAIDHVAILNSEKQVLFYNSISAAPAYIADCIKAFMFLKAGDTATYKHYRKSYLDSAQNNYTDLLRWTNYWEMTGCNKNDKTNYEDVLIKALKLDSADFSGFISAHLKLVELYYDQGKLEKSIEHLKQAQQEEVKIFDKGSGLFFPSSEEKIQKWALILNWKEWDIFKQ